MKRILVTILLFVFFGVSYLFLSTNTKTSYGSWQSPISAQLVASALRFSEVTVFAATIYWLECRPQEKGRVALMSWNQKNGEQELLPNQYSVRSRVHEMGGGALLVSDDGIYFVNDENQQIYCLHNDNTIQQITYAKNCRFADGCKHPIDNFLYYVMEDHGANNVINSLVKIDPLNHSIETIASGNDFYSTPRMSPDGKKLAYVTWNNPFLPWDATQLWEVDVALGNHRCIAGKTLQSIVDPQWSPAGELYYISDKNNWWNIYKADQDKPIISMQAEFALPPWYFARSLYGFTNNNEIICSYLKNNISFCSRITVSSESQLIPLQLPYSCIEKVSCNNNLLALIAMSPSTPSSIEVYDLLQGKKLFSKQAIADGIDDRFASHSIALEFLSKNNQSAHAFYYPPCNPFFNHKHDLLPPLLVLVHGGPISASYPGFSFDIAYWTSRGFAVVAVNYGGSTGYGRNYRERIRGQWGIVDVDDCVQAVQYCIKHKLADTHNIFITGGSAGGFTTLLALAQHTIFKGGIDYCGVTDLELLRRTTHKFESYDLEYLIGPYPQERALYRDRSPINNVDSITVPVLIFQGEKDKIVPPEQSLLMYQNLLKRKIPVEYVVFKDEYHGFRSSENIMKLFETQNDFLFHFDELL